jgi:hypothetical protein
MQFDTVNLYRQARISPLLFSASDSLPDCFQTFCGVLQNVMLPKSQNDPSLALQFSGLSNVALRIHATLLGPVARVALRRPTVVAFRAYVPEATIDEYRDLQSREGKIRFPWKLGRGSIAS